MNDINSLIIGLLCLISVASSLFALCKNGEEKPIGYVVLVFLLCTGAVVAGLHRLEHYFYGQNTIQKNYFMAFLDSFYPFNDCFLFIACFLLSYISLNTHIWHKEHEITE